jgi:Zn-dependent oligopeptidase
MKRLRILTVVAALAAMCVSASAMAQSYLDASSKARGDYGSSSANRSMQSARAYTQDFRQYARSAPKVDPEVAKDTTDAIGSYITKAQKHMAWMRAEARKANDKATLTSLDEIDKNLADASKSHSEMCDVCMKENIEAAGSMKCCQQMDESLSKAITEHDKLMKRLGQTGPTAK